MRHIKSGLSLAHVDAAMGASPVRLPGSRLGVDEICTFLAVRRAAPVETATGSRIGVGRLLRVIAVRDGGSLEERAVQKG